MERYTPHPVHLYYYVLPLYILGSIGLGIGQHWLWASCLTILLATGIGVWIIIAGINESRVGTWDSMGELAKQLNRTKDPNVWEALGFKAPAPMEPQLIQTDTTRHQLIDVGLTPAELRSFCQGILQGAPYTEEYWTQTRKLMGSKVWDRLKGELKRAGFIKPNNESNPRLGYSFTKKGRDYFLLRYTEQGDVAPLPLLETG